MLYQPAWLAGRLGTGATLGDVAAEVGCSPSTVSVVAQKLNITERRTLSEARRQVEYPQLYDWRWVRTQVVTKRRTAADIADELGSSTTTVERAIHRYGLGQGQRLRTPRPTSTRLRNDWRLFGEVKTIARLHGVSTGLAEVMLAEIGIFAHHTPAIPSAELRAALAAGDSAVTIARRYSVARSVVRVERHRLAFLDAQELRRQRAAVKRTTRALRST